MKHLSSFSLLRQILACLLVAIGGSGCALLLSHEARHANNLLTPLSAHKDAVELEVFFVDRIAGDPQIGEGLWSELHAVTVVDPAVRDRLNQHGFRFAMSPSNPPQSLQSLMALSNISDPSRRVMMRTYTVPSGQDAMVIASAIPPGSKVSIPLSNGVRSLEVDQGACMFRVKATRESGDWARIELIPEIQYGEVALRPRPTDHEWLMDNSARSVKLYEDRLSVELNLGEVIVLGLSGENKDSLGRRFFRSTGDGNEFERLLVIRLARMNRVEGQALSQQR